MLHLLLLLSLFFSLAHAAEPRTRTCRILFLQGPSSAPQSLFLFDGTTLQEVELPRMNFSPVYRITSTATSLALVSKSIDPTAAQPIPQGAPVAKIGEEMTDFYLLLTHDPSNRIAPVNMQMIDAHASRFQQGQMLWFNLTPNRISGQLGNIKITMPPQSRLIIDAPVRGQENYHIDIRFSAPQQSLVEPLCQTNWTHDPRSRSVVFIYQIAPSPIPRICAFPDFRPPP